jgi:hypothetical protein
VRSRAPGAFDPRFFEKHGLFWPIARAAAAFANEADWPEIGTYGRAFAGVAPVRFEAAPPTPRRRRRRGPIDRGALYDARITNDACVPTRPRTWHDFLNALVWATFPRAKRALHARQLRAMQERIEPGARTLPPTRSREQDALALLDEGGVVVLGDGREEVHVVFGHAVYEGLVLGWAPARACALEVRVDALPRETDARIALAEKALVDWVHAGPRAPEAMPRVTPRAS